MERCKKCRLCHTACPTGAIVPDRFLIHAEKCIVFHNEKPGAVPFPQWIDPAWHNSLIGCMHCQRRCPGNRDMISTVDEGCSFDEEETGLILAGTALEQMPAGLTNKIRAHDLPESLDLLPRNLAVLL